MSHPNATQGPLPILVALVLWGLSVLIFVAWRTIGAVDRDRARSAVSVFLFGVAAICGVLAFAEDAGITRLTREGDGAGLARSAVVFIFVGALVARAQARRRRPRRRHGHVANK